MNPGIVQKKYSQYTTTTTTTKMTNNGERRCVRFTGCDEMIYNDHEAISDEDRSSAFYTRAEMQRMRQEVINEHKGELDKVEEIKLKIAELDADMMLQQRHIGYLDDQGLYTGDTRTYIKNLVWDQMARKSALEREKEVLLEPIREKAKLEGRTLQRKVGFLRPCG